MPRDGACRGTKRDGSPCRSIVVLLSGFCPRHDPDRRAEARAQSAKGGRNRSTARRLSKIMPARLVPVFAQLEDALRNVLAGSLDPRVATAAASLARALASILQVGELEERLRTLEAAYGRQASAQEDSRRWPA